jgi:hypothetical protein
MGVGDKHTPRSHDGMELVISQLRQTHQDASLGYLEVVDVFIREDNVRARAQQNIEFAIVNIYRKETDMSDYDVMLAPGALIGWYRAEFRDHIHNPGLIEDLESGAFGDVKAVCKWRMGRGDTVGGLPQIPEIQKSLDDVRGCLSKIRKSVDKWYKRGGPQGYLTFVSEYV